MVGPWLVARSSRPALAQSLCPQSKCPRSPRQLAPHELPIIGDLMGEGKQERGEAGIVLPPSPRVGLHPWRAPTLYCGSSSPHSSGNTAWPPDYSSPDGNSPPLLKLISGLPHLFHTLSLVPCHWLLTHSIVSRGAYSLTRPDALFRYIIYQYRKYSKK